MASGSALGVYDQTFFASPLTEGAAPSPAELRQRYEILLEQGKLDYDDLEENMRKLKELVLAFGVPVRPFSVYQASEQRNLASICVGDGLTYVLLWCECRKMPRKST
jgi:hypothetical protein